MRQARLILEDGTTFCGWSFGYDGNFPLIGNYGVPDTGLADNGLPLFMESDRIHAKAIVVADYSETYSHWNAKESLASWLQREKVPGITGIDTRRLTKVLREHGVMMGKIVIEGAECSMFNEKSRPRGLWREGEHYSLPYSSRH